MLRALAQQLGRTCSSSCSAAAAAAQLEGPAALRQGLPSSTLGSLRWFSSQEDGGSETPSTAAPAGPSSSSKPSRLQTKEWRSWIDTKLDSKLEGAEQQKGSPEKAAAKPAAAAAAAAARPAKSAAAGKAGKPAAAKAPPAAKKLSGFELEQQIYNIVAPAGARPSEEAGSMPEGVTTYAQLAMASDAPRFARTASNVADISPHRLHPTRLFFPQQNYAPSELDPYKTSDAPLGQQQGSFQQQQHHQQAAPMLNPDEVTRLADYKNAPMLSLFLSEAGKLPVRRRTQLRAKLHRHLARQVKIARTLGILAPTARWQAPADAEGQAPRRYNNNNNSRYQQQQRRPGQQQQQRSGQQQQQQQRQRN